MGSLRAAQFFAGAAIFLAWASASAQGTLRGGKTELSASPVFTAGKNYSFANGAGAKTDSAFGLGIQWFHSFDDYWSAGLDMVFSGANYSGSVSPQVGNPGPTFTYDSRIETSTFRLGATYNFRAAQFTPFFTGGAGASWINAYPQNGPGTPVCWWFPYYGQVCTDSAPNKVLTKFTYNAGLGLRYDWRPDPYFVRAAYDRAWVDFNGNTGTVAYDQLRIDFGIRF
jgi:Outer membrane protein beta-barrel domain